MGFTKILGKSLYGLVQMKVSDVLFISGPITNTSQCFEVLSINCTYQQLPPVEKILTHSRTKILLSSFWGLKRKKKTDVLNWKNGNNLDEFKRSYHQLPPYLLT